jgi:tetratricopeptide (TPR) repeat protein
VWLDLALTMLGGALGSCLRQDPPADGAVLQRLNEGKALLARNDPVGALQIYREVLARRPEEPGALHGAAYCLLLLERYEEALDPIERLAARFPDRPSVHVNRGIALLHTGRPREAETDLRRAIEMRADIASAYVGLGTLLRLSDRAQEAIDVLREGSRATSGDPALLEALGETLAQAGRDAEAEESLREALRREPGRKEARFRLGVVLQRSGNAREALASWEEVVRLDPLHRGAWYSLGRAYAAAGEREKSRDALERFREISSLEERRETLEEALRARPDDLSRRTELAEVMLSLRKPAAALGILAVSPIPLPEEERIRSVVARARALLAQTGMQPPAEPPR